MKKEFEKAEVEVIQFEKEDVIVTSPDGPGGTTDGPFVDTGDEDE